MKPLSVHWAWWLGGALCGLAPAANAVLLNGHVGNAPVVMEFDDKNPAGVEGRYFYQKYLKDIPLSGTLKDRQVTLYENVPYSEQPTSQPRMTLRRDGQGNWQGQWTDKDGKQQVVRLQPAQVPPATASEPAVFSDLRRNDPYALLRLGGLKLRQDKTSEFMGHALQWQAEPVSGIRLFQVRSGYPAVAQQRINRVLTNRFWQSINDYYQCAAGAAQTSRPSVDFEQTVTPQFMNAQVISVSVFTSYDCGGAHPDFGDNPINLDVATGKSLQLEDILWLGKGAPPQDNDAGRDALQTYRDEKLAPWLAREMARLHPKAGQDECDYGNTEYWKYPVWYLTGKGLYISPSYPRAARVCEYPGWSVLPYKLVNQHRGPAAIRLP